MHFVSNSSLPVQYFISVYISLSNRVKSIKKGTNRILRLILYKTSLHMSEREREDIFIINMYSRVIEKRYIM